MRNRFADLKSLVEHLVANQSVEELRQLQDFCNLSVKFHCAEVRSTRKLALEEMAENPIGY